jgi:O-antigen/teichoic acid export membrane protein
MKKLFIASASYLLLGLASGVFFREFTKEHNFSDQSDTQLSVVHSHLLTLGFMFFLIVLILEKQFNLSSESSFNMFFWVYNVGLIVSTAMMVWRGILQVLGDPGSAALSGIAGIGHMAMSLALAMLLLPLGQAIWRKG